MSSNRRAQLLVFMITISFGSASDQCVADDTCLLQLQVDPQPPGSRAAALRMASNRMGKDVQHLENKLQHEQNKMRKTVRGVPTGIKKTLARVTKGIARNLKGIFQDEVTAVKDVTRDMFHGTAEVVQKVAESGEAIEDGAGDFVKDAIPVLAPPDDDYDDESSFGPISYERERQAHILQDRLDAQAAVHEMEEMAAKEKTMDEAKHMPAKIYEQNEIPRGHGHYGPSSTSDLTIVPDEDLPHVSHGMEDLEPNSPWSYSDDNAKN